MQTATHLGLGSEVIQWIGTKALEAPTDAFNYFGNERIFCADIFLTLSWSGVECQY